MTSTLNRRLARIAALSLCPVALVSVTAPGWAADGSDTRTAARAGTGALVSKTLSARTVLTSTSGKKLALTVGAVGDSKGSTVTIGLRQGKESHLWSFKARAADLKVGSTGAGTLTLSSAQAGSRGKLNLKLSPVDSFRKRTCGGQVASKSRKVAVSGIAYFKTGTRAWGNVGRSTRAIRLAGTNTVTWTYDVTCPEPSSTPVCSKATTWSSFASTGSSTTSISGTSNGTSASVSAFRSQSLATPAGASRLDMVSRSVPVPSLNDMGSSATLTASLGTGSLTVNGNGGFGSDSPCRSGSGTVTEHDTAWFGAATNGSPAFQVPAQVFGGFGVPDGSTATIGRSTF